MHRLFTDGFLVDTDNVCKYLQAPEVGRFSQTTKALLPLRHHHLYLCTTHHESVVTILRSIRTYNLARIVRIDLAVNNDRHVLTLAYVAFPVCTALQSLTLRRVHGDYELRNTGISGSALVELLSDLPTSLVELHLAVNMAREGLRFIAQHMHTNPQACAVLRTLDPSAFCLGPDSLHHVQKMASLCHNLETFRITCIAESNLLPLLQALTRSFWTLHTLEIQGHALNDQEATFLGQHMTGTLRHLHVVLGTTAFGTTHLMEGLAQKARRLQHFRIVKETRQPNHDLIYSLSKTLPSLDQLRHLDINCLLNDDTHVPVLLHNLPRQRLHTLHLALPLHDGHAIDLARALVQHTGVSPLQRLKIHTEMHFDAGIRALGDVLDCLTSLTHLDLSSVSARRGGMVSLLFRLPSLPRLEILDLARGTTTDVEAMALATVLPECNRLHTILLYDNCITDIGAAALAQHMRRNMTSATSLTLIDLSDNHIFHKGAAKLYRATTHLHRLKLNLELTDYDTCR